MLIYDITYKNTKKYARDLLIFSILIQVSLFFRVIFLDIQQINNNKL